MCAGGGPAGCFAFTMHTTQHNTKQQIPRCQDAKMINEVSPSVDPSLGAMPRQPTPAPSAAGAAAGCGTIAAGTAACVVAVVLGDL